eukprot:1300432-Amphidinium_carterae.1
MPTAAIAHAALVRISDLCGTIYVKCALVGPSATALCLTPQENSAQGPVACGILWWEEWTAE